MFLPHAIDMLNKRNVHAIQQLEAVSPHIRNLEQLCEQLNGELRDVKPISNNRFAFEIAIPATWEQRKIELTRLLRDFDHHAPVIDFITGHLHSWSTVGHKLVMVLTQQTTQAVECWRGA